MLQWQQTVHKYFRVLHNRIMKRPPKNVTMEEARNAHHMRCPLWSQGTSEEYGMTNRSMFSILDIRIEESWSSLLLILLVLIELSLPWGTVPSASASIEEPWRACASVPSPTHQPFCLIKKKKRKGKIEE